MPETVKSGDMYGNGQFDDIPYIMWDMATELDSPDILEHSLGKV